MTRFITLINGFKNVDMNLETSIEIEDLERKLKGFYVTYRRLSTKIQDELNQEDVDQEEYYRESETVV